MLSNFEYDPNKSNSNRTKHGIDFEVSQQLWLDANRVEIAARSTTESRWLIIGKIEDKHWSAIVTYREDKIRIISVRRSRDNEVNLYESGRTR
ncbi:MAG: BrnT family toxin [Spirulinaceae cyanobacterium]